MTDETKRIKILIVDDEVKFLKAVAERLALKEFDVTTASDGGEAVEAANKGRYDVALLDLRMPGMDGMEVLKTLKSRHRFLQVIMLTGHATIDTAVECTKLGAFKYLEKPFDFEKLMDVLREAYKERLRMKFERDEKRMKEIEKLATGSSPIGILRSLLRMDDEEK